MPIPSSALLAACLSALMLLAPTPSIADEEDRPRTISVTGTGKVAVEPDMVMMSAGVITEAETAREALSENTAQTAAMIEALKAAGIEARDLQTSNVSISPVWSNRRYQNNGNNEPPRIVAYQVRNTVSVRIRALETTGEILDTVVTEGGNQISGPHFGLIEPEPHQDEARKKAVADARRKAGIIAEAAGVTLAEIISIDEGGIGGIPIPHGRTMAAVVEAAPVPIEAGGLDITASVSVVWKITD